MGAKKTEDYTQRLYSLQEYVALEEASETKHEYQSGRIRAMSGGSINHSLLGGNIFNLLSNAIVKDGKDCLVLNSDARIYSQRAESVVYPYTSVICGGLETHEEEPNTITNPMLIVEVLSKSTAHYDRGDKFKKYASIPSFREYVLIDQNRPVVDVMYRETPELWRMASHIGLDKTVYFHSLDISIPMEDIYKNTIDLQPPDLKLDM